MVKTSDASGAASGRDLVRVIVIGESAIPS